MKPEYTNSKSYLGQVIREMKEVESLLKKGMVPLTQQRLLSVICEESSDPSEEESGNVNAPEHSISSFVQFEALDSVEEIPSETKSITRLQSDITKKLLDRWHVDDALRIKNPMV